LATKVVVTGANSAVGQAILKCGAEVVLTPTIFLAAVRSERAAEEIRSQLKDPQHITRISYVEPASLDAALQGAGAVIHLPGILVERRDSTYEQANVASTRGVVESAKRAGVGKFVLVSATRADETSANRYYRTKGQAETLVRASGLPYTVLRAPLLLGPGTAGSAALKRNASLRRARLIGGGRNLQQPLYVKDLARAAVIAATQPWVASNLTLDLVGPVSLPERELVEQAARRQGHEIHIGSIPRNLLCLALAIRQSIAGPGFSPDVLEVITADTRIDPQTAASKIGIQLTGIDEMIQTSLREGNSGEG
jgi:NADH dehydrogenase